LFNEVEHCGEADFMCAFARAGYKDAQSIHAGMVARSPDFKLGPLSMNTLGYQLLRAKNARGAVELFKLATFLERRTPTRSTVKARRMKRLETPGQSLRPMKKPSRPIRTSAMPWRGSQYCAGAVQSNAQSA
jgi:hypothetical protein